MKCVQRKGVQGYVVVLDDSARARDQQHQLLALSASLLCVVTEYTPPTFPSGAYCGKNALAAKGGMFSFLLPLPLP